MKTNLLASLEDVVSEWIDVHCMDDDWPDGYIYSDLSTDMTKAAELVFDASMKGQEFAKKEGWTP